ncbi:MAG: WecB/TagA/CpsF family glycosyltransferase [Candidatus Omnitrophota bacterium]
MDRVDICGTKIDNISFSETIERIEELILRRENVYIVTPNIDHIVRLRKDEELRLIYNGAVLVLADGKPLLWAAKFLGSPLKEKISGSDLFPKLCAVAVEKDYKVFFLGGREGAAQQAAGTLKKKHGNLQVTGCYSPPFGFENNEIENTKIIRMIREAKPEILFVGLGSPKQEKWIYKFKDLYDVPVSIGIGVSFEFVAGMVKRAPLWMQKCGLEWSWRLMLEPGKLWKRYLVDDMEFFWLLFKQKFEPR